MEGAVPTRSDERIVAIDVVRGFALFGVLWMNLQGHDGWAITPAMFAAMPTQAIDEYLAPIAKWLMAGKAQTLFSILFGFGFANMMSRLESRGLPAGRIFLRRLTILLAVGMADMLLLWDGDILLPYATMGFLLYALRGLSARTLLYAGLFLSLAMWPLVFLAVDIFYGGVAPWAAAGDKGLEIRSQLYQQSDYPAYVAALWRAWWIELLPQIMMFGFFGQILGRFMLGAWLFRKGWLQQPHAHKDMFAKVAGIGLSLGLALSAMAIWNDGLLQMPTWLMMFVRSVGNLVLAAGYAAALVHLVISGRLGWLFAGLGAVGRTALSNYLTQSFFYLFVIYGFGLNLLPYLGATLSLALALGFFFLQMMVSRWWMDRYRFGPLEWLWRSATYGERQPMMLAAARS